MVQIFNNFVCSVHVYSSRNSIGKVPVRYRPNTAKVKGQQSRVQLFVRSFPIVNFFSWEHFSRDIKSVAPNEINCARSIYNCDRSWPYRVIDELHVHACTCSSAVLMESTELAMAQFESSQADFFGTSHYYSGVGTTGCAGCWRTPIDSDSGPFKN